MSTGQPGWLESPLHLLAVLAALLPILAVGIYIHDAGVNVPSGDEWASSVEVAVKAAEGSLGLGDLLASHGPHRYLFTNATTALLTYLTRWNVKLTMYASLALAVASLGLLGDLVRRQRPELLAVLLAPFSVLLFSFRQQVNWLWGLQSAWFFSLLFFLAAIWLLERGGGGWTGIAGASLAAWCATFSIAHGAVAWPALFLGLGGLGYGRRSHRLYWLLAAAVGLASFLVGHGLRPGRVPRSLELSEVAPYLLAYLGGPFVSERVEEVSLAMAVGAGGLVVLGLGLAYLRWRGPRERLQTVALVLGTYALGSALLTGLGRAPVFARNPVQPLRSRYVTGALPLWLAVVVVAALVLWHVSRKLERRRWELAFGHLQAGLLVLLLALFANATLWSLRLPTWPRQEIADCLRRVAASGEGASAARARKQACLELTDWGSAVIAHQLPRLARHRLSLFSAPPGPLPGPADLVLGNLDWRLESGRARRLATTWQMRDRGLLEYGSPIDVPLAAYRHLYVQLAVAPEIGGAKRSLTAVLKLDGTWRSDSPIRIPLSASRAPTAYRFDLQRLDLAPGARLEGLRLWPVLGGVGLGASTVELFDVRLLPARDGGEAASGGG